MVCRPRWEPSRPCSRASSRCAACRSITVDAERLFVALDVDSLPRAEALLDRLGGVVTGCKIGSQLFTATGPAAVEAAHKRGYRVFLDLKFHASGGRDMMRAAGEAAGQGAAEFGVARPLCLGVTVLTSLDRRALQAELRVPASVGA